jgi:hypothetical protein
MVEAEVPGGPRATFYRSPKFECFFFLPYKYLMLNRTTRALRRVAAVKSGGTQSQRHTDSSIDILTIDGRLPTFTEAGPLPPKISPYPSRDCLLDQQTYHATVPGQPGVFPLKLETKHYAFRRIEVAAGVAIR